LIYHCLKKSNQHKVSQASNKSEKERNTDLKKKESLKFIPFSLLCFFLTRKSPQQFLLESLLFSFFHLFFLLFVEKTAHLRLFILPLFLVSPLELSSLLDS